MKKLRKWLVEETGELRPVKLGETSFNEIDELRKEKYKTSKSDSCRV